MFEGRVTVSIVDLTDSRITKERNLHTCLKRNIYSSITWTGVLDYEKEKERQAWWGSWLQHSL